MKKMPIILVFLLAMTALAQVPPPQVPLTGNIGPQGIFPLFNHGTIVMPADANYTMAFPDMTASVLRVTSSVPLTATRNVIAPQPFGFEFTVQNATTGGQAIIFTGPSGAGVPIPNGSALMVMSDGVNYVSVGGGGGTINAGPQFHIAMYLVPGGGMVLGPSSATVDAAAGEMNVQTMLSVGSPTHLPILSGVTGAVGGTCGANTLTPTTGEWAIACNAANEVIIPNTLSVPALKVTGDWSWNNSYAMSSTVGTAVLDQVMATPTADTNYFLTWQLQQTDTGSGGTCSAGAFSVVLQFTPVGGAQISPRLAGHAIAASAATNNFTAGTAVNETNYFVGIPFEFTAGAGAPLHFILTQTTPSNCTTGQHFVLRAHLKGW